MSTHEPASRGLGLQGTLNLRKSKLRALPGILGYETLNSKTLTLNPEP